MFWSAELHVELKNYSSVYIDVMVRNRSDESKQWRVIGFYGAPEVEDRSHNWRFMRTLHSIQHDAWICIVDFNETLFESEHFSRTPRPERQMRAFREVMDECTLTELGWLGLEYTWDNMQPGRSK